MTINSKYFDSIRIRSGKKAVTGQDVPKCNWTGCEKLGQHRAPVGRGHDGQYFCFCIKHVREYNKKFNYFNGLSDDKIKDFQNEAAIDHCSTWRSTNTDKQQARAAYQFSTLRSGSATYQNSIHNTCDIFNRYDLKAVQKTRRKIKTLEARAFSQLGLKETASSSEIRTQYKTLVKLHHPDSNGGDRSTEDRFREVLQAYNLLKQSGFC